MVTKVLILIFGLFISFAGDGYYPGLQPTSTVRQDVEPGSSTGTIWVLLIAGSHGFQNYDSQADVCFAYHTLRKGGIDDKNIIVFMYDDIAYNHENHKTTYGRFGYIFTHRDGKDVYKGVPKDYTGRQVTVENILAVLRGDKSKVSGGSRKVMTSTFEDRVFIYFTSHGGPGLLQMPHGEYFTRKQLLGALKEMNIMRRYKSMVIYIGACHSGSMISKAELPPNILVITSANPMEKSFKTNCHRETLTSFLHCLATHFGVSWIEDSDTNNRKTKQIDKVREDLYMRVHEGEILFGSHVSEYGAKGLKDQKLYLYHGFDPNGPS